MSQFLLLKSSYETRPSFRSWHGDCFFDEESRKWNRLEVPANREIRDKPGISGCKNDLIVAGGTVMNETGQKQKSKIVEKFVII